MNDLNDRNFYIFGNTTFAQIFYLFCKENQIEKNIKAFLVSDIKKDKRNRHIIHGIPVRDIEWLKNESGCKDIFFAGKVKTVIDQMLPLLKDVYDGNLYYVSDFVHTIMYSRSMYLGYEDIVNRYSISQDLYETGLLNLKDIQSKQYYKYMPRVSVGYYPDHRIFNNSVRLDELYRHQLGDYSCFENIDEPHEVIYKCKIYMSKSHFDKELTEDFDTPYTETIQVGADLTDQIIAKIKDNTGINISVRNKDYCEMSAVYWAWKNDADSDYIGFCHYRRRFVIDESIINYIMNHQYEAVYTIPKLTDGGMREEFVERNYFLTPEVWKLTGEVIEKLFPEYSDAWKEFGKSFFLLSCNMFIMRRDIFNHYCSWVFAVLKEVDEYYLLQGIQCDNRYLGYISECLNTVYVMKHKNTLKKGFVQLKMLDTK